MEIYEDSVVIKNSIILNYLNSIKENSDLTNRFEDLIETLCKLISVPNNNNDILLKLSENIIDKTVENVTKEIFNKLNENSNINNDIIISNINKNIINNMPIYIKGIISTELININTINTKIENIERNIFYVNDIKNQNDNISKGVDKIICQMIKETTDIKTKGEIGENTIYNLLCQVLRARDGYEIIKVNGISMSCDILIKRIGYPNIRLEIKSYGKDNGRKVDNCEVLKFKRDLEHNNDHGIMISLYSNIIGVNNHDIEIINNNKIAVYLANNEYDTNIIEDNIHLIYKLDSLLPKDNIQLSMEKIKIIKTCLKDFNTKITDIKNNLHSSIRLLNDIRLDSIQSILEGKLENETSLICSICNKTFASVDNRKKHENKCPKIQNNDMRKYINPVG
jgi:hypothetical protein